MNLPQVFFNVFKIILWLNELESIECIDHIYVKKMKTAEVIK